MSRSPVGVGVGVGDQQTAGNVEIAHGDAAADADGRTITGARG